MCQATNFQNSATNFQNSEMKVAVSYSDFGGGLVQHRGKKYCRHGDFDVSYSGATFGNLLPGWSYEFWGEAILFTEQRFLQGGNSFHLLLGAPDQFFQGVIFLGRRFGTRSRAGILILWGGGISFIEKDLL